MPRKDRFLNSRRPAGIAVWCAMLVMLSAAWSRPGGESRAGTHILSDSLAVRAVFQTIRARRTVREFLPSRVPREHVLQILDAARFAPTAGNVQPWRFVVLERPAQLDSLRALLKDHWKIRVSSKEGLDEEEVRRYVATGVAAIDQVFTAPVYVLVFVDTSVYPDYALYDGCLAVENLMLAARALGYGTGFFTTYFPEDVIKSFVHAPAQLRFVCATPIGVPKEWPPTPPKKELAECVVFETFPQ